MPLSDTALLTNTPDEPSPGCGAERRTCECRSGRPAVRIRQVPRHAPLAEQLTALRERGVPLRVITTTYLGGTERRAVDELVRRYGAEVRIRYEEQSTRLHAKAWLFRRDSGFDTGYVGSSNLSKSALVDGLEWNVRISSVATPALVRKFEATFDTYWNNPEFRPYDPDRDADLLDRALGAQAGTGPSTLVLSGLEVRPRPHQERILEALEAERTVHDRHRNLVVAATGTGKTVVAALDYRRLGGSEKSPAVRRASQGTARAGPAHLPRGVRRRHVRRVARRRSASKRWKHVFASVQSLREVDLPAYDVAVSTSSITRRRRRTARCSSASRPIELLGLTATPGPRRRRRRARVLRRPHRRRDRPRGGPRAGPAVSVPLLRDRGQHRPHARVEWKRGSYDAEALDRLYTGNDARTRHRPQRPR